MDPLGSADLGLLSPVWAGTPAAATTSDAAVVQALLDVESAWVAVQASVAERSAEPDHPASGMELASRAQAHAAEQAANAADYDLGALAQRTPDGGNVLIPLLKDYRARVAAVHGEPVAGVHRGATSQDVIDTGLALVLRRTGEAALADLEAAADALAVLAARHRNDVAIARSLTQHALPITVGHRIGRWLGGVDAARVRLSEALASLPLQWGGAAGTLASLVDTLDRLGSPQPVEAALAMRDALATQLGLRASDSWHTQRAAFLSAGAALAQAVEAAGKVAADVLILARPEVAELTEPQKPGKGGSSAMPHKRNPVLSVAIKEAALEAPSHLSTLFLAAGQAVDERPDGAWHAEWPSLRSLARLAGGSAARLRVLAEGLQVFPSRAAQNVGIFGDLVLSERLAARLSSVLPGGKADLEAMTAQAIDAGVSLGSLVRAAISPSDVPDDELAALLDPAGYLGVAGAEVDRAVARHQDLVLTHLPSPSSLD
jgi:3-carboxy-cis,cis-muconate cycloisomerase